MIAKQPWSELPDPDTFALDVQGHYLDLLRQLKRNQYALDGRRHSARNSSYHSGIDGDAATLQASVSRRLNEIDEFIRDVRKGDTQKYARSVSREALIQNGAKINRQQDVRDTAEHYKAAYYAWKRYTREMLRNLRNLDGLGAPWPDGGAKYLASGLRDAFTDLELRQAYMIGFEWRLEDAERKIRAAYRTGKIAVLVATLNVARKDLHPDRLPAPGRPKWKARPHKQAQSRMDPLGPGGARPKWKRGSHRSDSNIGVCDLCKRRDELIDTVDWCLECESKLNQASETKRNAKRAGRKA